MKEVLIAPLTIAAVTASMACIAFCVFIYLILNFD